MIKILGGRTTEVGTMQDEVETLEPGDTLYIPGIHPSNLSMCRELLGLTEAYSTIPRKRGAFWTLVITRNTDA